MSEAGLWATMRKGMHGHWREATRHEDSLQKGIADVSFVSNNGRHGWVELKKLVEWPKRASTILRIDHYTDEQRLWLKRKGQAGGNTWLFVQVGRDYMLFDWAGAQTVGHLNRSDLENVARQFWNGRMKWDELGWVFDG